ncbi:MAG TPA: 3'-5' exonuclease [Nitrococcus sp.]|nr:3'-5' exonuclease [Nitrococcus sp.]
MHSSKGLEFPVVAILGLGYLPYKDEDPGQEARVLYVAITRAMEELIMMGHRESAFLQQVEAAVGKVSA